MKTKKTAIVVGASSGMGREVALLLLADGWTVGLAARRTDLLESIKEQYPAQTEVSKLDITQPSAPQTLYQLIEKLGGMDLYFHASGIGYQNAMLTEDRELRTVDTNALGFTRMIGAAYRWMAQHGGGQIAVISSIAGVRGLGPAPAYSATKAFQNVYIQALEQQAHMRNLNIAFTDIRPGFVDTALLNDGTAYPMLMNPKRVAQHIVKAIARRRHKVVIDWRYKMLVAAWHCVPGWLWRRLSIHN